MTIVLGIGFVVELALSMYLLKVVHRHEWDIYNRELKIEVLQHDIDTYNESIKVLSGSVRKLNEVVKDLEQKQPKIEPKNRMNTRAFIECIYPWQQTPSGAILPLWYMNRNLEDM